MTDKVTTVDELGTVLSEVATPKNTAIAKFDPIAAGLAQLKIDIADTKYDIATTKGLDTAKRLRAVCVKLRTNAGEVYDLLNRPMLDQQTLIRGLKAQFVDGVKLLEDPLDLAIKAQEKIKEQERQARVAAEELRVKALRDKIAVIASLPTKAVLRDAKGIAALDQALAAMDVDEVSFAEFVAEADALKTLVRAQLGELFVAATNREAETERVRLVTLELEAARAQLAQEALAREAAATLQREVDEQTARIARKKEDDERAERQRQADETHANSVRALKTQQDAFEAERVEAKRLQAERDAEAAAALRKLQAQVAALQPMAPKPVVAPTPAMTNAAVLSSASAAIEALIGVPAAAQVATEMAVDNARPCDALIVATLSDAFDAHISDVIAWLRDFNADACAIAMEEEEFVS